MYYNRNIGKGETFMKNWNKMVVAGLVAGSLALGSFPVLADTASPGIDQREACQQGRIYRGVDSGQLTLREFTGLEKEQARIRAAEARMKADGTFTRRERYRVNQMLDRSSRHVYRAKHHSRIR